jgi:hypothetical protein
MKRSWTLFVLAFLAVGCATEPRGQTPAQAVAVVTDYYRAINAHDYARAYAYWDAGGAASGRSFDEFKRSFAGPCDTQVKVGTPTPIEGAAGSRFITIPVTETQCAAIGDALLVTQRSYDLRYSAVEGATRAQRHWHLYRVQLELGSN